MSRTATPAAVTAAREKIVKVLADALGKDEDEILPEHRLGPDLELGVVNQIEFWELKTELQDEFDVDIPEGDDICDNEKLKLTTVQQLAEYMAGLTNPE